MLVGLASLWLPILVATVLVFIASALIWTVLPHHKSDFTQVPDEAALMKELNRQGVGPGMYSFPWASSGKEAASDAFKDKVRTGVPAILHVVSADERLNMGPALLKNFVYYLVLMVFVAYVAGISTPPGAEYRHVFRVVSTVTFLAYAGAMGHYSIWFGQKWGVTGKHVIDSLVYGLLAGGVFGWLWP